MISSKGFGDITRLIHLLSPSLFLFVYVFVYLIQGSMSGQDLVKSVSQYYFGSVTVVLDTQVASEEGYGTAKEASEAAYGKLALDFGLDEAKTGRTPVLVILHYITVWKFQ